MLKSISAALIAASLIAAPAMAAGPAKTADKTNAPAAITKPVTTADSKLQVKSNVRDANAKMGRHHHRHMRHHHRSHHKFGLNKTFKHTAIKATASHIKRG
jgi:hypothetical protein